MKHRKICQLTDLKQTEHFQGYIFQMNQNSQNDRILVIFETISSTKKLLKLNFYFQNINR